jgi:hypothetical protein
MANNFTETINSFQNVFQKILKNIISLGNDSTLETDLKPLKVGGKNTPIELSENEVKVTGTINADAINVNGSAVQTGTDAVDAGMIIGYTDIGLDEATATYNTTTSYAVPTSEFNVAFTAPPSGNVEISIQVMYDVGASNVGDLYAGLSDNATYNSIDDFHEVEIYDGMSRGAIRTIKHSWTLTGLTAGTSYTRWVGFRTSGTTGTPHLQWGGDATNLFPDFIMKATALPETIST